MRRANLAMLAGISSTVLTRGSAEPQHRNVGELTRAIQEFIAVHNEICKLHVW